MRLLKFSASWCGPCKMLSNTLSQLEVPVPIEEVDVDTNTQLAMKYGIRGVPTMVLVTPQDEEVSRVVGNKNKTEITDWINKYVKE
jgi:thioredoxin 1